jgi:hypothetical protein
LVHPLNTLKPFFPEKEKGADYFPANYQKVLFKALSRYPETSAFKPSVNFFLSITVPIGFFLGFICYHIVAPSEFYNFNRVVSKLGRAPVGNNTPKGVFFSPQLIFKLITRDKKLK